MDQNNCQFPEDEQYLLTDKVDISPYTIARTICLILALVNQLLAIFGRDKIPFVENDIYQIVSVMFTIVVAVRSWWKNNSFTIEARMSDTLLYLLKRNKKEEADCDENRD